MLVAGVSATALFLAAASPAAAEPPTGVPACDRYHGTERAHDTVPHENHQAHMSIPHRCDPVPS